jgi:nitric oxide reductase subunit B
MVFLDLFPAGLYQFKTATEQGLWYARSSSFIDSTGFQTLTWLRIVGGSLFTVGGVIPMIWFITTRIRGLKGKSSSLNTEFKYEEERENALVEY